MSRTRSNGVLEYWDIKRRHPTFRHYASTPVLQHSEINKHLKDHTDYVYLDHRSDFISESVLVRNKFSKLQIMMKGIWIKKSNRNPAIIRKYIPGCFTQRKKRRLRGPRFRYFTSMSFQLLPKYGLAVNPTI